MSCRPKGRLRRFWDAVRRRLPFLGKPEPPEEWPWVEEPALVPVGPPRRPLPASGVALEPPFENDPLEYPTETDAVGKALPPSDDDELGESAAA